MIISCYINIQNIFLYFKNKYVTLENKKLCPVTSSTFHVVFHFHSNNQISQKAFIVLLCSYRYPYMIIKSIHDMTFLGQGFENCFCVRVTSQLLE